MKIIFKTLIILFIVNNINAQVPINDYVFTTNNINSEQVNVFLKNKIKGTQFIMLGEQHGIKEVGEISNKLFNLGKNEGYKTLCIETSPFAAKILELQLYKSKSPESDLKKIYDKYPFAIPFYNNKNDVKLFKNVLNSKGEIWGIDQVFMAEFRLIFDYLVHLNDNDALKKAVKPLLKEAKLGFEKAVKEKNMMAPFMFKYSNELHNKLMNLSISGEEKEMLTGLKKTKEIYMYNFQKQYYKNNNQRAKLMKSNFLNYYNKESKSENLPKVVFKLGANHVAKGLNTTNVLDISNMISELAVINNKTSLHIYAMGINGTKNLGNPFAPVSVVPFDNTKVIPKEVIEYSKSKTEKYIIVDTEKLRNKVHKLSSKMKNLILKYDVLIYINNCKALDNFN